MQLTKQIIHRVSLLVLALALSASVDAQELAVYLDGVRGAEGDLVIRLYRTPEGFPDDRRWAYREVRLEAEGSTATVLFDDVPSGRVAVVAFHDVDADGRVRLGADGVPLDGVATPNWTGGTRPDFDRSAVRVGEGVAVARLRLRYPESR